MFVCLVFSKSYLEFYFFKWKFFKNVLNGFDFLEFVDFFKLKFCEIWEIFR